MPRVATQLIVFGERAKSNLEATLAAVAEAGYDGAETGLMLDDVPPKRLARALADAGLGLAGCHAGFPTLARSAAALEYVAEAGGKHLVCSGVGGKGKPEFYEQACPVFNQVGELALQKGMVFCYHNHSWEFESFGGKTGFDILCQGTDPNLVKLCVDTFWVADAGQDPAVFLYHMRKRIALIHLKDGRPKQRLADGSLTFLELGAGDLDFPSILKMATLANPPWLTVEQDRSTLPPSESIRRSRQYLRDLGV